MLISIAITIFIIFYAISGFSWRMGCHLFGSTFFLPLVVALLALSWRFLDIQSALVFVSAKIAQSQALTSLWGAVLGVMAFWLYVAGTQSGYLVE